VHHRVIDLSVPDPEGLWGFLMENQLIRDIRDGGAVCYIHCWAGRGRAGTVGAALWLLWDGQGGADKAKQALAIVQAGYSTRPIEPGGSAFSPETAEQLRFVRAFAGLVERRRQDL